MLYSFPFGCTPLSSISSFPASFQAHLKDPGLVQRRESLHTTEPMISSSHSSTGFSIRQTAKTRKSLSTSNGYRRFAYYYLLHNIPLTSSAKEFFHTSNPVSMYTASFPCFLEPSLSLARSQMLMHHGLCTSIWELPVSTGSKCCAKQ